VLSDLFLMFDIFVVDGRRYIYDVMRVVNDDKIGIGA